MSVCPCVRVSVSLCLSLKVRGIEDGGEDTGKARGFGGHQPRNKEHMMGGAKKQIGPQGQNDGVEGKTIFWLTIPEDDIIQEEKNRATRTSQCPWHVL